MNTKITVDSKLIRERAVDLHGGYLNETVLISTGAESCVSGQLTSYKVTKRLSESNSRDYFFVKVTIDGVKYELEGEEKVIFLNLYEARPNP